MVMGIREIGRSPYNRREWEQIRLTVSLSEPGVWGYPFFQAIPSQYILDVYL
jgi:hypothetical protein